MRQRVVGSVQTCSEDMDRQEVLLQSSTCIDQPMVLYSLRYLWSQPLKAFNKCVPTVNVWCCYLNQWTCCSASAVPCNLSLPFMQYNVIDTKSLEAHHMDIQLSHLVRAPPG